MTPKHFNSKLVNVAESRFVIVALLFAATSLSVAIPAIGNEFDKPAASPIVKFRELEDKIPLEARSRRKWDSPVVADLDRDGRMDLILTDHSRRAMVHWNNVGVFSQPETLMHGDTHGLAAGDYDQDGLMDLVIYPGGGGGKNPRNPAAFHISKRTIEGGEEFVEFERSRGRAVKLVDFDQDGMLDLVLSAFPLRTQTAGANQVFRNSGNGQFEFISKLPRAKWMGFRMLVTDFNDDNDFDLILYGGDDMVAIRGEAGMGFSDATAEVFPNLNNTTYVSSIAEIDYDNDGDLDLFLTRADHPFERASSYDPKESRFAFFVRNERHQFDDFKVEGDFALENLQMAYPDFDVIVGAEKRKLIFDVDRHGSKEFRLSPEEAQGWPTDQSDRGLYVGHVGNGYWRLAVDTKSPTAGVIHNVKSDPGTTTPKHLPALLFENREGTFIDVTTRLGINIQEQTTCSAVGDFDNDGWPDLFIVRHGNPAQRNQQILLLNRQGKSFEPVDGHEIISHELGATGGGAEAFDYDDDGDLDIIYCNERGRWHLVTNELHPSAEHKFIKIKVGMSPARTATAQGAVLTLKADGRSFRRTVGSSATAFSHSQNNHLHIGLGSCDTVESATLRWTNGETLKIPISAVNRAYDAGHLD